MAELDYGYAYRLDWDEFWLDGRADRVLAGLLGFVGAISLVRAWAAFVRASTSLTSREADMNTTAYPGLLHNPSQAPSPAPTLH